MIIKFASVTSNPRGKRRCMIVYLYCMANFIYLFLYPSVVVHGLLLVV